MCSYLSFGSLFVLPVVLEIWANTALCVFEKYSHLQPAQPHASHVLCLWTVCVESQGCSSMSPERGSLILISPFPVMHSASPNQFSYL